MKKRILSLIILFAMILPFIPTPASAAYNAYIFEWGSGTKDNPYLVNSSSDMEKLIKQVNSGNTFRGEYIKLAANISFTPSAPIGDYPYNIDNAIGFEGTFDGNNCTITYTINNKGTDRCAGLFGYNSGTIKNLKVNATITVSSGLFIGGVAAYNDGTITNCTSSGTLSASCISSTYIGGIAGYNTDGTIQRCENSATIQHVSGNAGGIVGRTDSYSKTNKVEICSNSGPVTTTNSIDTGGIAGSVYNCNIVNCYNAATITGTGNVGGIVGKFSSDSGSISNCYDIGTQTLIKPSLEGGSGSSSTRWDDIVAVSDTVTPKNCYFTNRNYSDGEITYSLQSANSVPVWGQEIGVDPYPIFTEDIEKSVRRVQFYDTGVIQTNYVNYNKKIPTPPTMSEKDTAAFLGWVSSKDMKEPNYNADTLVTEDMSFYALYRVNFAGQSDNIAISVSNGRDSYINLYPYLKYYSFNSSVSAGKFTYDIIEGNDELNAGISDDSLVIPGSATAGTYNIKVKATEKQPFISTISFDNYGTEPVTLNITVTVIDTIIISNADDLKTFANRVNNGEVTLNARVVADIDFSEYSKQGVMIGTKTKSGDYNSYQGVFDGGGYKITLNYDVTSTRVSLFQYVGTNCNIKNVYTTGSINTTETVAAGVVAQARGNTSNIIIENCYSDVNIYQNNPTETNAYQGGIVGYVYNSDGIIIRNCGFTGTLDAAHATQYYGGVVGYVENSMTTVIENCYFAGTAPKATGSHRGAIYTYYSSGKEPQLKNCCYNSDNAFDTTQGTGFTSKQFRNGEVWEFLSNADEITPWRQSLDADAVPYPFETGGHKEIQAALYYNIENFEVGRAYSNTHTFEKPNTSNGELPEYICKLATAYKTENGEEIFADSDNTYTPIKDKTVVYISISEEGNGTKEAPFEIDNADMLALFAKLVNSGYTEICGKVVADIDFSEHSKQGVMIGTQIGYDSFNSYQGVFDGGGYKITLNYDVTEQRVGLFQYVGTNCNIKNVYTTGSINTTSKEAAGVVAYVLGNTSNVIIENCYSDVNIYQNNSTETNAYQGGIVASVYNSDGIIIRNCGFTGTLNAANATKYYGGIVGEVYSNKTTVIENCYFAGTAPKATGKPRGEIYTYNTNPAQLKNCCYKSDNAFSTEQGTGFTSKQFRNGEVWEFLSNENEETPWCQNLNADATPFPFATGGHKTVYCLRFKIFNTLLYEERSNDRTFKKPDNSVFPPYIKDMPLKYATEQGTEVFSDNTYTVSEDSIYNEVYLRFASVNGNGTKEAPYEIDNADKLALFAELVNIGCTEICGKVVADIDFSEYSNQGVMIGNKIGNNSFNSYQGVFDGGGHKITLNYNVTEQRVSLFQYVGTNCNIKNVYTTGSINTTETVAAGVVAYALGNTSNIIIENCYSDVSIYQNNSTADNAYQGGIVGYVYNSDGIIIRNCGFTGTLDAANATNYYGGVVGYVYNSKTTVIESCYFAGTAPKATGSSKGAIYSYYSDAEEPQLKNCCYNSDNAFDTTQGTGFTSEQFRNGEAWDFLSNDNEETPWRQSLDADEVPYPYEMGGHKTVYCLRFNLGKTSLYREFSNGVTFEKPDNSVFPSIISGNPLKYETEQGAEVFSDGNILYTVSGDSVYNDLYLKLSLWDSMGTIDDPYEIDNADKLALFAELVNGGCTGICGKVIADIDFSEYSNQGVMIGTELEDGSYNSYKGTFDGGGYKITLNYNVTEQRVSLFQYAGTNCNIKNVYTTGSINTTSTEAAGVVAYVPGNTSNIIIENCYSDVYIYQNNPTETEALMGGIVGYVYNSDGMIIRNCGFTGTLNAANATKFYGGVVGYVNNNKTTVIENCYYAGTAPKATGTPRGAIYTYNTKEPQLKNCCYKRDNAFSTAEGTGFTSEQFTNGDVWDFLSNDNEETPWRQSLNDDTVPFPFATGGHKTVYCLRFNLGNILLYEERSNNMTFEKPDNSVFPSYISDKPLKYATEQGTEIFSDGDTYTVSGDSVYNDVYLKLSSWDNLGTIDDPYEIDNADKLAMFAELVNNGATEICGKVIADIDFSEYSNQGVMIGTQIGYDSFNSYHGVFDGGGYKITLNYDVTEQRVGLFQYVGTNCNIKNVYTTGSINTTSKEAAGVVAYVLGNTSNVIIENCYSDVNIYQNNSTETNAYQGGIVASVYNSDGIIIRNCGFTGTLNAANATQYYGGIVGEVYSNRTTVIENCYFAGTAPKATGNHRGAIYTYNTNKPQLKNCCYNSDNAFDTTQGTGFTSEQFRNGEVWDFLSNADETTLWRQSFDADEVPYPYETGGHEKVAAVTFITESGSTKQYANYGDDITLPPLSSGDNQSAGWYIKDEDGNYSPFENPVKGNTTLYAESRIMYGGENDNMEINITYGDEKTVDLSRYVEYANSVDTKDKFAYKITNGNDVLRAVIEGDTLSIPANIDVGTYTLEITATEKTPEIMPIFVNSYGFEPVTFDISVKITEAPSSVKTSPTAKDLTYTGEPLELVTAGEAEGGEMQYSLDGETYSSDVPKGTNADVYTVWYKVKGDSNHNDSTPQSVNVTIKKADSTLTVDGGEVTYGDTITLTADVKRNAASGIRLATTGIDKVEFYIGETSVGSGTVTYDSLFNDSGTAKIEIKADKRFEIGANTIRAEYGGSINLNNSEKDEITVTMKQKPLNYEVSADGKVYDKNTSVNVMLTPTNNGEDDVTLTAKGAVSSADVGSYSKVDLTDIKADGADAKYYSVETEKNEVNLTGDIEITKAPSNVTSAPAAKDLTYDGTAQELVTAGETDDGTMQYSLDNDTYSPDIPKGTDADTYTVWYKVAGDSNHNDSEPQSVEVTLKKAAPSATVTPKDLKYTGEAQELVTGETSDGTLKYATDEAGEYTDAVPTGTEAKDYEVWYKVVGDGNHNDSTPQKVDVTIKKANSTLAVDGGEVTYGDTITLTATVTRDNTNGIRLATVELDKVEFFLNGTSLGTANVTYSSLFDDEGTAMFEITANKRFEIGANTIRAEYGGSVNLNGSENNSITVTMKQKPLTYDVTADGKVYDENTTVNVTLTPTNNSGDNVTLTAKGTVSSADVGSYSKVDLTEIALGGEDAKYYSVETEKNEVNLTGDIEITKAPSSVKTSPAANALTYTSEPLELVTAGEAEGGEMQYSLDNISYSTTIPTGTNADTYTVWYKVKGDSNHNDSTPQSVNVTIKKADSTLTVDGGEVTYGDAITLTATVTRDNTSGIRLAAADIDKVEFFLNETSLGSANVTYNSLFNDSGTATLTITADKKFEIGANTIRAEYGGSINLNNSEKNEITVNMNKKPLEYSVKADGKVYDENTAVNVTLTPTNKVGEDDVTLTAVGNVTAADVGSYNNVNLTEIKADGADAKYYSVETEKSGADLTAEIEITKAPSSVKTSPAAKDLTYTGEPLELVTAGEAEGGEMQYSLDGETYSPDVPKGTNANTYTVWYKVKGDSNHKDTESQSVNVTIKKANSTLAVDGGEVTYGDAITLTATVTRDNTSGIRLAAVDLDKVEFFLDETSLGTANVTYGSLFNDSGTATLTITADKKFEIGANTIRAEYGGSVNLNGNENNSITVTMKQKPLNYEVSADGKVYDENTTVNVTLTPTNKVGEDSVTLTAKGTVSSADVGSYNKVDLTEIKVDGDDAKYYSVETEKNEVNLTGDVEITKAPSSITSAPVAKTDLTYTGEPLELVTAGEAEGGEMQYSLDGESYSPVLPKGTNADTYTVWYKVVGDNNHSDSTPQSVEVTIKKAASTATVTPKDLTYTGEAQELVTGETTDGTLQYSTTETGIYSPDVPTGTNANTYTVWYQVVGDSNHNDSETQSVDVTIKKAAPTATVTANDLHYIGVAQELVTGEVVGGTLQYSKSEDGDYSPDIPTEIEVGTYTIWYKVVGDDNHTDLAPQSIQTEIKKAASVTDVTDKEVTYKDVLTLTATVSKKPFNGISLTALEDKVNFYLGETLLGSADVSYTNTELKDSGTATLEITADKRFAVGENTIRAEYGGSIDLAGSKNDNIVVTLNKKPIEYTVSAVGKTYDSNAAVNVTLTPTNNGEDDVTLTAKGAVSFPNAGSYGKVNLTEIAIGGDDAEYYSVDAKKSGVDLTSAVEITKAPSSVKTSPTAKDLTYTGEPLELVTAGEATGGTMQYSLDGETYSPDIPKGTNADTYMVWYKVAGDNNHNDSEPQSIDVTIKKAASSATVLANDLTYTGDAQELVTGEATGGTLQYSKSEDGDYSSDIPTEIEVGTYTIWYKVIGDNNHTDSSLQSIQTEIKAKTSRGGGGGSSSYTVQFETNGGSKVTSQRVSRNGVVKEPTAPTKNDYTFAGWYTDKGLKTEYDFTSKVTKSFTLYAKWNEGKTDDETEATPAPTGEPTTEPQATAKPDSTTKSMPFTDVNAGDWFYNNVQYVYENGLMSGVSNTEFAPNENVTRGMFVTILYRMDGEPNMGASAFTDVPSSAYYADAVAWANANGIVEGYSDTEYAPDDAVTREQAAAILFRFAAYKGNSPTGAWAIQLDYADLTEISDWAAEGVMFCTMEDIMVGHDGGAFDPKANITRAEGAAVINRMRYFLGS